MRAHLLRLDLHFKFKVHGTAPAIFLKNRHYTSRFTKHCACHSLHSRSTKCCDCHEICTTRSTKCCACHKNLYLHIKIHITQPCQGDSKTTPRCQNAAFARDFLQFMKTSHHRTTCPKVMIHLHQSQKVDFKTRFPLRLPRRSPTPPSRDLELNVNSSKLAKRPNEHLRSNSHPEPLP